MTFSKSLEQLASILEEARTDRTFLRSVEAIGKEIDACLSRGGIVFVAGNGGSAAEAQHFSAELVGRYRSERRGLPSIALTTDTSILTAVSNDYGFDRVFERQIEALGRKKDILVVLSTSGNSENLVRAVVAAKKKKISTVALLGCGGGALKPLVDAAVVVPSENTARIQEIHLSLIHFWCEKIDGSYGRSL
ncbi:SIS domain-containing protein [Patescibacteria group bacterium]|nr:SIS domain-containing protein [Patescibacteria group bacterium]